MGKSKTNESKIMNFEFRIDRMQPAHVHTSVEILYILEGNAEITVGESTYQARAEDVIVVNSNKRHSYRTSEDGLIGQFSINTRQLQDMLGCRQLLFWCNSVANKSAAYKELRIVMRKILGRYFEQEGNGLLLLHSLYYELLEILVENFIVRGDDRRIDVMEEDRVSEIVDYIETNYQKKLSLSELADHLYLSTPYLSKYIKKNLGMNFVEYVNSVRMFHAMDGLLNTSQPIIVIALENGFANGAAFNDAFKKVYHMTPSEYRQSMKTKSLENNTEAEQKQKEIVRRRISSYLDGKELEMESTRVSGKEQVEVQADKRERYNRFWNRMINVGRAADLLRSDMQEQVLLMKKELGFRYIRIWDVFGDGMLLNEGDGKNQYYFERLDKVLDFLVDNEIYPYLELGHKPKELYRTLNDDIIREKTEHPFSDRKGYEKFLNAFAVHIVNRYGLEEVENWYFEQWSGEEFDEVEKDSHFFEDFGILYRIMKSHSSQIMVGGGGIGIQFQSINLENLIAEWSVQKYHPDFLSLYCYPYIRGDEDGVAYARQSTDREFLKNQLEMAENAIRRSDLGPIQIHVSEWSSTISNRNALNDSCYKGAYIVKNVLDSFGKVGVLGYWSASDIFAEHTDCSSLLFGGCGLLNSQGIKKPAFFAYYFLNQLGKYLIHCGEHEIVTTNGNGNYSVVCHNYRHLNYKYYMGRENEVQADKLEQLYEDTQSLQLTIRMNHVKNGRYKIKTYSINNEYGSILEEWFRIGETDVLSRQEVDYLKRICTPHIQIRQGIAKDGVLQFETLMQAQEIQYIHISYQYES